MKFLNLFSLVAAPLVLIGAQSYASAASVQIEGIAVSDAVTQSQAARLQSDLNYMKTMNFSSPDADMLSLMGITDSHSDTLINWLTDRVSYIVDENIDLKTALGIAKKNYSYENPGILPTVETPTKSSDTPGSQVMTVMSNIGGGLYYAGKTNGMLLNIKIEGVGKVNVTSPRTGILKVGQGLFATFKSLPFSSDSKPYIAMRLSTLFHEARHSDGNGKSLGFLHATCPDGAYAGYPACDRNLNGPYQVEAKFINTLIAACTDCTDGDKVGMKTLVADAASRQIRVTPVAGAADANSSDIKVVQTEIESCKLFASMNMTVPGFNCDLNVLQKQLADLQSQSASLPGIPSVMWDATPEGI